VPIALANEVKSAGFGIGSQLSAKLGCSSITAMPSEHHTTQSAGELARRHCVPCRGGTPALPASEAAVLARQIQGWEIVSDHHLGKQFKFRDFRSALDFVNKVGEIAEAEGHHPDIALGWGRVHITLWTHAAGGLTENDFIMAAKLDQL
jgi:4a-hydroxytetrahydrobiopterin dehydratase